jgi:MFS family permease
VPAPPRVLASYYAYQATASCVFYSPIFFLYYQDRAGLDVPTVLALQSYALAVRALLDLPFGALADRTSRRGCLIGYAVLIAAGAALLVVHPTLAAAVVAETLFATASALRSGADSAWLFDALQSAGALGRYPRAESRGQALVSLASGTTAVAGGLLASIDLRWPYVATVAAALASAAVALSLSEEPPGRRRTARLGPLVREAGAVARASSAVRWVMALAALAVVASHVYFYLQQPYLRAIGVPVAAFGLVFAATKLVTAAVASQAHRIDRVAGSLGVATLMAAVPACGLAGMSAVAGPAGALLVLSRGLLDGLWQPLANVYLNRLVDSRVRATMLSLQSLVARLALALAVSLLGLGTALGDVRRTLALAAGATAVLGVALRAAGPRALRGAPACRPEAV